MLSLDSIPQLFARKNTVTCPLLCKGEGSRSASCEVETIVCRVPGSCHLFRRRASPPKARSQSFKSKGASATQLHQMPPQKMKPLHKVIPQKPSLHAGPSRERTPSFTLPPLPPWPHHDPTKVCTVVAASISCDRLHCLVVFMMRMSL